MDPLLAALLAASYMGAVFLVFGVAPYVERRPRVTAKAVAPGRRG